MVGKVREALNGQQKAVNGSSILVLGVAYKPDVDDVRESPAIDIILLLEQDGAQVVYHDPHVPSFREAGRVRQSVDLTSEALETFDAVVIATNHSSIDYSKVLEGAALLVDARNAVAPFADRTTGRGPWIVKGRGEGR